jgi:hypothetical protein
MEYGFVMILGRGPTICTRNIGMCLVLWPFNRYIKIWLLDIVLDFVLFMYAPPFPSSGQPNAFLGHSCGGDPKN